MWLSLALAGMEALADNTDDMPDDMKDRPAPKRAHCPVDTEREEALADYHAFASALAHLETIMGGDQIKESKRRLENKLKPP